MPCRDYSDDVRLNEQEVLYSKYRAAFCAVMTFLSNSSFELYDDVLAGIDWRSAGITKKEFLALWNDHQREDAKRREQEEATRRREETRKKALSKLTPEERKILGLK